MCARIAEVVGLINIPKEELVRLAKEITKEKLCSLIDHTELKPEKTEDTIRLICDQAKRHGFYSVCVNSCWAPLVAELLKDSSVKECYVVGFPLGAASTEVKVRETRYVVETSRRIRGTEKAGKLEIDLVMNIGFFKKDPEKAKRDIEAVVEAADGEHVKVIIETGLLKYSEIEKACKIVMEAGAHFVKNSTGFGPIGATLYHVKLMREFVGEDFGVKAAGGIVDFLSALRLIYVGAPTNKLRDPEYFRIGTSSGINILRTFEWKDFTDAWYVEEIPCRICPNNHTEKMPKDVQEDYTKQCVTCPYKRYRRYKDYRL